jgi:DNA-binding response OmpR family regulator
VPAGPYRGGPALPVLLAEHEPAVADMVARYLTRDGLEVRRAATGELALEGLADRTHSAAVLDLTMPGLDPRRVRRALRIPVVFLAPDGPRPRGLTGHSARGEHARRWLTRPFGPRLLVATVRELLHEAAHHAASRAADTEAAAPAIHVVGGLRLDGRRRVAVLDGRDVPLTQTEFRVLAALMAAPGRAMSRRLLLTAAGRTADDRAADVYIAQLRAKLGDPTVIRTVRGAGYAIAAYSPLQDLNWAESLT